MVSQATLYDQDDCAGTTFTLEVTNANTNTKTYNIDDLIAESYNDRARSVKIPIGYQVTTWLDNFTGTEWTYEGRGLATCINLKDPSNASSFEIRKVDLTVLPDMRFQVIKTPVPSTEAAAPNHDPLNLLRLINDSEDPTKGPILYIHGFNTDWISFVPVEDTAEGDTPTPF